MAAVRIPAPLTSVADWPISFADVLDARRRIRPRLPPTPLRHYPELDSAVGLGIRVLVKHENHQPTNSFKVRNGLSLMTALSPEERASGLVAATRGNHGLGLAWAGALVGVPVTLCVPVGNNPDKNAAMRGLGAEVLEGGRDYDEAVEIADRLARERGLHVAHSTNDARVIAGAATLALEIVEEEPDLQAIVAAVGGGSHAVGAITVARALRPDLAVYGVQAAGARAIYDAWRSGKARGAGAADTFAGGIATRNVYELTFEPLRQGLADFVLVGDGEIAEAVRILLATTHNMAEGAGAAGLAGLLRLRERLAGRTVAIVVTGGNLDGETLRRIVCRQL